VIQLLFDKITRKRDNEKQHQQMISSLLVLLLKRSLQYFMRAFIRL